MSFSSWRWWYGNLCLPALVDYFTDSHYQVELEKDLSLQQQYLDVIIIEQTQEQALLEV